MEKVMCTKCGSIGYTASPDRIRCSGCGGKHKVIPFDRFCYRIPRLNRMLSLLLGRM